MKPRKMIFPLFVMGLLVMSAFAVFVPSGNNEEEVQQESDIQWAYNKTQDLKGILFLVYSPNKDITEKYLITKADKKRWIIGTKDSFWLDTNDSVITVLPNSLVLKESNTSMLLEVNPQTEKGGKLGIKVKLSEGNRSFENQFEVQEVVVKGRYLDTTMSWNPFIAIVPPTPEVIEG